MSDNKTKQKGKGPDSSILVRIFRNIAVSIQAPGPAAIIIIWLLCVTGLGLFGSGEYVRNAFNLLAIGGGMILMTMAAKV